MAWHGVVWCGTDCCVVVVVKSHSVRSAARAIYVAAHSTVVLPHRPAHAQVTASHTEGGSDSERSIHSIVAAWLLSSHCLSCHPLVVGCAVSTFLEKNEKPSPQPRQAVTAASAFQRYHQCSAVQCYHGRERS